MARTQIEQKLFQNNGNGPLLNAEVVPTPTSFYQQTLTASGDWTAPYTGFYFVELQGGGGGSGAVYGSGCTLASGGAPSGGYKAFAKYYAAGTVMPYTIGAGGAAGILSSAGGGIGVGNGGNGGNTTFDGTTVSGGAGSYGISYPASAAFNGLYPGPGRIAVPGGQNGGDAVYGYFNRASGVFGGLHAGAGGASTFGTGGNGGGVSTGANAADQGSQVSGYGAGAGGAASNNLSINGNPGGAGCVRVTYLGV